MEVAEAIRRRRAVRSYTDREVPDEVLDRLLRLALTAPTGSGKRAWGLLVVRDDERRREIAELVIAGGGTYFTIMRPRAEGASDEEHERVARDYAEQVLGSYRQVPVWILGLIVPKGKYPPEMADVGRDDDLISLAFAMENLMVAARAEGLGTVPTTAFQRFEKGRLRSLLGIPPEVDPAIITPLGYPESFPTGLSPALQRHYRPWRELVHDDAWGSTRA